MKYAVIIVNWNGCDDTLACLDSFVAASPNAVPIVIDNGSADDSVARITAALSALVLTAAEVAAAPMDWRGDTSAVVIAAGENLGFAAGCNLGLRLANAAGLAVCVFLNNDTVVEAQALDLLVARLAADPGCCVTLPMITVDGSDRIWNCGGALVAIGLRRYHLAGRPRAEGAARPEIACSFFTGCCFAIRTPMFSQRQGFSERFFFGEEDFELALWMKDRGLRAVCLTAAVVAHKVSASFSRAAGASTHGARAKVFVYYLNRFIHMRLRLGAVAWVLWLAACLPYTIALLLRTRVVSWRGMPGFMARLLRCASRMDRVTRGNFEALMRGQDLQ